MTQKIFFCFFITFSISIISADTKTLIKNSAQPLTFEYPEKTFPNTLFGLTVEDVKNSPEQSDQKNDLHIPKSSQNPDDLIRDIPVVTFSCNPVQMHSASLRYVDHQQIVLAQKIK